MNSYVSIWIVLCLVSCRRVNISLSLPHYRPSSSPVWLIRPPQSIFSFLSQIITSLCAYVRHIRETASYYRDLLDLHHTSELVAGIPRLIRLIMSLNSKIIIALLFCMAFYSPGSLCRIAARLLIGWAPIQELSGFFPSFFYQILASNVGQAG